jgi:hypothetical protein
LNSYFVPVYAVNEDYRENGSKIGEEKAAYTGIYRQALEKKFSAGSVHVYIVSPQGEVIDSAHVAEAAKPAVLRKLLEKNIQRASVKPGTPVAPPKAQAAPPACGPDELKLHSVARSIDGKGAWSEIPGEDWIILKPAEMAQLLPKKVQKPGEKWEISQALAEKLFTHFYPATENNDLGKNKFQQAKLQAELMERSGNRGRVRLQGEFRMEHSFYHKADGKVAEGNCVGYLDFDATSGAISSFDLVTEDAIYNGGKFAVAVHRK